MSRDRIDDDDNEDFDDRPRRRRPKKKKGMPAWVIALIVMSVLCVIGVPVMIALLLPAVQKVRQAANRANESNNLKQIALAEMSYNDMYGEYPARYVKGDNGPNRQLSGRVAILPYLEQQSLYNQFRRDEAWDSTTNRPLGDIRVSPFVSPAASPEEVRTQYLGFAGPGSLLDPEPDRITMGDISDGLSNTILLTRALTPVFYSEPKEIPYSQGMLIKPTLDFQNGSVPILMGDGSVTNVTESVSEQALQAGVTRNGGEMILLTE